MIKFVYFDVGGVIIKDFSKSNSWIDLQNEIGLGQEQEEKFKEFWDRYPDIATTRDVDSLRPLMEKEFKISFPNNYSFLIDGFIKRFKRNESLWPVIEIIHKNLGVGLLTNMYVGMFEEIKKHDLFPKINWDVVIDSSQVKLQKPDIEIFKLAEEKARFKGKEILFVENSQEHVNVAKSFGWQTFFYDSANYPNSSEELMKFYLKLRLGKIHP
jgi:FMN phosphatase YigB (HAD superfamily)